MKNLRVLYAGRYNKSEILSGPEKTAKRIFHIHAEKNETLFIEYYFEGSEYSIFKKLFGKETVEESRNYKIIRAGIFRIFFIVSGFKPDIIHFITFERFAVILFLNRLFRKIKFIYNVHGIIAYEDSEFNNYPHFYRLKNKTAENLFTKLSNILLFLNDESIEICKKYYSVDEKKVMMISNGIDEIFSSKYNKNIDNHNLKFVIYNRDSLKIKKE